MKIKNNLLFAVLISTFALINGCTQATDNSKGTNNGLLTNEKYWEIKPDTWNGRNAEVLITTTPSEINWVKNKYMVNRISLLKNTKKVKLFTFNQNRGVGLNDIVMFYNDIDIPLFGVIITQPWLAVSFELETRIDSLNNGGIE